MFSQNDVRVLVQKILGGTASIFSKGVAYSAGVGKTIPVSVNGKVIQAFSHNVTAPGQVDLFYDNTNDVYVAWASPPKVFSQTLSLRKYKRQLINIVLTKFPFKLLGNTNHSGGLDLVKFGDDDQRILTSPFKALSFVNIGTEKDDFVLWYFNFPVNYGRISKTGNVDFGALLTSVDVYNLGDFDAWSYFHTNGKILESDLFYARGAVAGSVNATPSGGITWWLMFASLSDIDHTYITLFTTHNPFLETPSSGTFTQTNTNNLTTQDPDYTYHDVTTASVEASETYPPRDTPDNPTYFKSGQSTNSDVRHLTRVTDIRQPIYSYNIGWDNDILTTTGVYHKTIDGVRDESYIASSSFSGHYWPPSATIPSDDDIAAAITSPPNFYNAPFSLSGSGSYSMSDDYTETINESCIIQITNQISKTFTSVSTFAKHYTSSGGITYGDRHDEVELTGDDRNWTVAVDIASHIDNTRSINETKDATNYTKLIRCNKADIDTVIYSKSTFSHELAIDVTYTIDKVNSTGSTSLWYGLQDNMPQVIHSHLVINLYGTNVIPEVYTGFSVTDTASNRDADNNPIEKIENYYLARGGQEQIINTEKDFFLCFSDHNIDPPYTVGQTIVFSNRDNISLMGTQDDMKAYTRPITLTPDEFTVKPTWTVHDGYRFWDQDAAHVAGVTTTPIVWDHLQGRTVCVHINGLKITGVLSNFTFSTRVNYPSNVDRRLSSVSVTVVSVEQDPFFVWIANYSSYKSFIYPADSQFLLIRAYLRWGKKDYNFINNTFYFAPSAFYLDNAGLLGVEAKDQYVDVYAWDESKSTYLRQPPEKADITAFNGSLNWLEGISYFPTT